MKTLILTILAAGAAFGQCTLVVNPATGKLDCGGVISPSTNGGAYWDGTKLTTTPTGGAGALCYTSTDGGAPVWGSCAGSASTVWSSLSAPSANLGLSMVSRTTTFTSGNATSTANLWTWTDTSSNTGTGYLATFSTAASSTLKPFRICAAGTTNCVTMDASGAFTASGSATIAATTAASATSATSATNVAGGSAGQVPFQTGTGTTGFSAGLSYNDTSKVLGLVGGYTAGQTGTATGSYKINGQTSGVITITGASSAGTWSLTLPTNPGTDKYVLMTNGSGVTSWAQVDLGSSVTGNLPVSRLNNGTNASATTFWRGDGTWAAPAGSSAIIPYTTTVTAQTSVTVTAATHGQGQLASAFCWSNDTPRLAVSCDYSRAANGDMTFSFSPAFTGLIQIGSPGAGVGVASGGTTKQVLAKASNTDYDTIWIDRDVTCQSGMGDGLNAIPAGTYQQAGCYNAFGNTWTITSIRCRSNNNGATTLNVTDAAGTSLLTSAITCNDSWQAGTLAVTHSITSGGYVKLTFIPDGTSTEVLYAISGTY